MKPCGWEAVMREEGQKRRLKGKSSWLRIQAGFSLNVFSPKKQKSTDHFPMSQFINRVLIYVHAQPAEQWPAENGGTILPRLNDQASTVHPSNLFFLGSGVRERKVCTFIGKLKMEGREVAHGLKDLYLLCRSGHRSQKNVTKPTVSVTTRQNTVMVEFKPIDPDRN